MKRVNQLLFFLHMFIGIGAMGGGFAAIQNPYNPMGIGVEALHGYFDSFFLPGVFLFLVIGIGNLLCIVPIHLQNSMRGYTSGCMGGVLLLWIIIQCVILGSVVALHIIFGALGIVQGMLALMVLAEKKQFPLNILLQFSKR